MVSYRGTGQSMSHPMSLSHGASHHHHHHHPTPHNGVTLRPNVNMQGASINLSSQVHSNHSANANNLSISTLNGMPSHMLSSQSGLGAMKHENSQSSHYTNMNCLMPSHHFRLVQQQGPIRYPRAPTPQRADGFHVSGATTGGYIGAGNSTGGSGQSSLRGGPSASQPPTPPQQPDLSKQTMAGHGYVQQQQTPPQQRPPIPNYPSYRTPQTSNRPAPIPRQQTPSIYPNAGSGSSQLMYSGMMGPGFLIPPSTHMSLAPTQYTQQQRPPQQYYQQNAPMGPIIQQQHYPFAGYGNQQASAPYLYTSGSPQMAMTMAGPPISGRTGGNTMGPPPNGPPVPPVSAANSVQQQNSSHSYIHTNLPALAHQAPMHGNMSSKKAPRLHAIPVVHPDTGQNIMEDFFSENQATSGESSERQTPQPETTSSIISVAEEFNRMVNEKAKESDVQPELPIKSPDLITNVVAKGSNIKQSNIINSNSTSSIIINALPSPTEQKMLVTELVIEPEDTPVVSAISNSPEIVPKICLTSNKPQKSPEHNVSPTHMDGNKNQPKLQKQAKLKSSSQSGVEDNKNNNEYPPTMPPQPQRVKKYGSEPRSNRVDASPLKSEEKDSPVVVISSNTNGPEPTNTVSDPENITPIAIVDKPKEDNLENKISAEQEETVEPSEITLIEVDEQPEISDTPKEDPSDTQGDHLESLDQPHLESNATEAQAKLNQSIASCNKISNQTGSKMKDINHTNKTLAVVEADANCNSSNSQQSKSQPSANDIQNESLQPEQKVNKTASLDVNLNESEIDTPQTTMEETEVSRDETDKAMVNEYYKGDIKIETYEAVNEKPAVPVLKYNYKDDQWSPVNTSGKKCYDKDFLLQLQDDPKSKQKPENISSILSVIKTKVPSGEGVHNFSNITKIHGDTFLPPFAKNSSQRGGVMRGDVKKNMLQGKSSAKGGGGSGMNKPNVIHVSLSLREDVKLNETENAWKPNRMKPASYTVDDQTTQDLYKKVRGVLNKLTPQKFDTLIDQVKELEIDNETRLEGVIELVFEKAIDEPNFSVAYALMCKQLALLKVPASNPEDEYVNFRKLILTRCQKQFLRKNDHGPRTVSEKDIAECTDPMKRKELQAIFEEEERRIRMRSVGNVRFIGELFKQQMLTVKIMMHCIKILLDGCEDEQLECLCKLLTTIGKELDSNEQNAREVQDAFKKMQALVDRKSNKLNSRIRFMLQDVIELRKRNWVLRHNDVNPKTIDQIQKEADMEQMQIQMMNSGSTSVRKDEGSRSSKRGGGRSGSSNAAEEGWSSIPNKQRPVDTNKLRSMQSKAVNQITLGPPVSMWHRGSGAKGSSQPSSNSMSAIGTTTSNNMYGPLENLTDSIPSNTRGSPKDPGTGYHSKGGSIERSTFKPSFAPTGITANRSGSVGGSRSNSSTRKNPPTSSLGPSVSSAVPLTVATPSASTNDKVMPDEQVLNTVQKMMDTYYIVQIFDEFEMDVKQKFSVKDHPNFIRAIFNVLIELPAKKHQLMVDVVLKLVAKNIISPENFYNGLCDFLTNLDPDIVVDVPKVYDYVAFFVTPHIIHQTLTLPQLLKCSEKVIEENKGGTILREVLRLLIDGMGPNFVKAKWHESGMNLRAWMHEDQVNDFKISNKLEFLDNSSAVVETTTKVCLLPEEARKKILQLMQTEQSWGCINAWIQDNIGASVKEGWFIRVLFQAMCEFSLLAPDGRTIRFDKERMTKYVQMITEFGDSKESRESNCLFGIQQLVHRLEHPQGITLELFQYLSNEYIISPDGFLAWEMSDLEPEGKGVMLKALVSFFTELREGDNEDSCGED